MGNFEQTLWHGTVIGKVKEIALKGARLHNLKNIDVSIPKNKALPLPQALAVQENPASSLTSSLRRDADNTCAL
jgi:excinuclease UvrABC ATPase subunit